ncbi:MAG TPA: 30S ribosomal protein S18 [Armatimonadetes bacterium]|nr:30S ribosomal protein S18 [Armatimonadota bacterium]
MGRRYGRRGAPVVMDPDNELDYKNHNLLVRFLTERGKILPRRQTGLSARYQRLLTQAIKRAREIGLLPYARED